MAACNQGYNEPTDPRSGDDTGGSGGTTHNVTMSFTYRMTGLYTYAFTNKSSGATSYKWDFGDGEYANTKDATHTYPKAGTYTVTLTGTCGSEKYDTRAKVTVTDPKIYVAGYVIYKMPYENKYYKVVCKDDDWFSTNWGFETVYTPLLDNSDLPYTKYFNDPIEMTNLAGDNYYTLQLFWANSTTESGTQCLKQELKKDSILQYKPEHIMTSNNGEAQIGILMEYK